MLRRQHTFGLALLLALATTTPALAQPFPQCNKPVSTAESELAHQKYIAGKQDYDEGNYDSAVRRFRDAYNLDCTKHELLIIISAAYERKGDKKEAVAALETYVSRAPSAPDLGTYQAKIENLKKQIAAAPPPSAPNGTAAAPSSTTAPTTLPSAEREGHSPWPWVVVGVGAAAVVVGVVVVATTTSLPEGCSEETEQCTPLPGEERVATPTTPKQISDAEKLQKRQEEAGRVVAQPQIGLGLAIGGGVLVAGGLAWHFLEPTGWKETGRVKLRPSVAPGYAGLALGGRF